MELNQLHLHQLSRADNKYPPGRTKRQKECLPGRIRTVEPLTASGLPRPLIRCLEPLDHRKCSMCWAIHPGAMEAEHIEQRHMWGTLFISMQCVLDVFRVIVCP